MNSGDARLSELYKLAAEMADGISARRGTANGFSSRFALRFSRHRSRCLSPTLRGVTPGDPRRQDMTSICSLPEQSDRTALDEAVVVRDRE
jgi:hypothetical protein